MNKPSFLYRNQHLSTILPSLYRKGYPVDYQRERVETLDGDFFDIDCLRQEGLQTPTKLIILLHGLEGSAEQHYITSQAHQFYELGFDIIAMNFRTCSGEMNRTTKLYHSGETGDLSLLIKSVENKYDEISLIGFSLGGNVLLKYLGETKTTRITSAAAFSAPIDLESCAYELEKGFSRIYCREFMSTLSLKAKHIQTHFKDSPIDSVKVKKLKTFLDYDEKITAPLFGFKSAKDYWARSSSLPFLKDIQIPTLIMSAKNDPFLGKSCYPKSHDIHNTNLIFEYPRFGGHVGFISKSLSGFNLMDIRAKSFILGASSC
jgi:predicted alpha/beta-fold hydrolase